MILKKTIDFFMPVFHSCAGRWFVLTLSVGGIF